MIRVQHGVILSFLTVLVLLFSSQSQALDVTDLDIGETPTTQVVVINPGEENRFTYDPKYERIILQSSKPIAGKRSAYIDFTLGSEIGGRLHTVAVFNEAKLAATNYAARAAKKAEARKKKKKGKKKKKKKKKGKKGGGKASALLQDGSKLVLKQTVASRDKLVEVVRFGANVNLDDFGSTDIGGSGDIGSGFDITNFDPSDFDVFGNFNIPPNLCELLLDQAYALANVYPPIVEETDPDTKQALIETFVSAYMVNIEICPIPTFSLVTTSPLISSGISWRSLLLNKNEQGSYPFSVVIYPNKDELTEEQLENGVEFTLTYFVNKMDASSPCLSKISEVTHKQLTLMERVGYFNQVYFRAYYRKGSDIPFRLTKTPVKRHYKGIWARHDPPRSALYKGIFMDILAPKNLSGSEIRACQINGRKKRVERNWSG